ncbi:hypothetical protein JTB14_009927 [Gonioctena quinquepunctata]|nr:hypothetical protein JTB14_009927 [Gonioctena quinquepunctata]
MQGKTCSGVRSRRNITQLVEQSGPTCIKLKKSSGEYRFCFYGRKLDDITKHDSYPPPLIDRTLNQLRDAQFISSVDLRKAFWQVPSDEASKEKTAFSVPGQGLF